MTTPEMWRFMTKRTRSGPSFQPILTCSYICSVLFSRTPSGCFMLILHLMLAPSQARTYSWESCLQRKGFLRSMWRSYLVPHPLSVQELVYWLLESKALQYLLSTGVRRPTLLSSNNGFSLYLPGKDSSVGFHLAFVLDQARVWGACILLLVPPAL